MPCNAMIREGKYIVVIWINDIQLIHSHKTVSRWIWRENDCQFRLTKKYFNYVEIHTAIEWISSTQTIQIEWICCCRRCHRLCFCFFFLFKFNTSDSFLVEYECNSQTWADCNPMGTVYAFKNENKCVRSSQSFWGNHIPWIFFL